MNIKEAFDKFKKEGKETLEIYYAEDISIGDEKWSADVMQDEINELCKTNWTWTIISKKEFDEDEEENKEEIPDWEIIVDKPFSEIVVKEDIEKWIKGKGYDFKVDLIPLEKARGSGYIKTLKERLENNNFVKFPDDI